MNEEVTTDRPIVVAPSMGYGHLRAAWSVAEGLGGGVRRSDRPPLANWREVKTWGRVRHFYESLSRMSQKRISGLPAKGFLEWLTGIPPIDPPRDQSAPNRGAQTLERLAAQGFLRTLTTHVRERQVPLVSTFYAEAIAADRADCDRVFCVATDADVNRVWAPLRPSRTRIHYLAPTRRVARRLRAFGVPEGRIEVSGFPLPPSLVGGEDAGVLRRNLSARLAHLDPHGTFRARLDDKDLRHLVPSPRAATERAPLLVFAVGGAGAQTQIAHRFLRSMRRAIETGRLRLALVAGVRIEVARLMVRWVRRVGLRPHLGRGVRVLWRRDFPTYYRAFNRLLAEADVLWTKPGELVFYAALGLPLVLSPPVGVQERANARWVLDHGAALWQHDVRHAGTWLLRMLEDGVLAGTAWSGYMRLPHDGTQRIAAAVRAAESRGA